MRINDSQLKFSGNFSYQLPERQVDRAIFFQKVYDTLLDAHRELKQDGGDTDTIELTRSGDESGKDISYQYTKTSRYPEANAIFSFLKSVSGDFTIRVPKFLDGAIFKGTSGSPAVTLTHRDPESFSMALEPAELHNKNQPVQIKRKEEEKSSPESIASEQTAQGNNPKPKANQQVTKPLASEGSNTRYLDALSALKMKAGKNVIQADAVQQLPQRRWQSNSTADKVDSAIIQYAQTINRVFTSTDIHKFMSDSGTAISGKSAFSEAFFRVSKKLPLEVLKHPSTTAQPHKGKPFVYVLQDAAADSSAPKAESVISDVPEAVSSGMPLRGTATKTEKSLNEASTRTRKSVKKAPAQKILAKEQTPTVAQFVRNLLEKAPKARLSDALEQATAIFGNLNVGSFTTTFYNQKKSHQLKNAGPGVSEAIAKPDPVDADNILTPVLYMDLKEQLDKYLEQEEEFAVKGIYERLQKKHPQLTTEAFIQYAEGILNRNSAYEWAVAEKPSGEPQQNTLAFQFTPLSMRPEAVSYADRALRAMPSEN